MLLQNVSNCSELKFPNLESVGHENDNNKEMDLTYK